jgi:hypothetical protein
MDWTFLPVFRFSLGELAQDSGVAPEIVRRVIEGFCLQHEDTDYELL